MSSSTLAAATPDAFRLQLTALTAQIAGRPIDLDLQAWLNREHGAGSETYALLKASCQAGVAGGWLCEREHGGIRYGRIFPPADDLHGFSVDVVDMQDIAGPHHVHPEGEIDLVMPVQGDALFDGQPAGWVVCPPGSGHRPTVTQGRALVLYLLPNGNIRFTR
jgi:hypothetical protein